MAYYRGTTKIAHLQSHKNNYFNIAKARRERSRGNARRRVPDDIGGVEEQVMRSRSASGEHKRTSVRGGCLGAEGRRRTRRPAKRSGGAACERGALRVRMGQPVQRDGWTPAGECIARWRAVGELKHLSSPTRRNQTRFPQ